MAKTNGAKSETSTAESSSVLDAEDLAPVKNSSELAEGAQDIDEILNSLKALLSALEKLQKARQEVGDIKPLILQMLDGEMLGGEELEQLKAGVSGLAKLVRSYSDHQTALVKAQPARTLLDQVIKEG
jgi:Fic family protein